MSELPKWPDEIRRDGPYKVYKGEKYVVYDDGNSAETPYQTDLAEAAIARLKQALMIVDSLLADECTCDPAYSGRQLADPTCEFCDQEDARFLRAQIGPIP